MVIYLFGCLSSRKRFPYYIIEGDSERNTVQFKLNDETFSVEELIAQILQKAREFAEISTGECLIENYYRPKSPQLIIILAISTQNS